MRLRKKEKRQVFQLTNVDIRKLKCIYNNILKTCSSVTVLNEHCGNFSIFKDASIKVYVHKKSHGYVYFKKLYEFSLNYFMAEKIVHLIKHSKYLGIFKSLFTLILKFPKSIEICAVFEVPTHPDSTSKVTSNGGNGVQSEGTLHYLFSKLLGGFSDASWLISPEKEIKNNVDCNFPDGNGEKVGRVPPNLMFAVLGWTGIKPNISIEVFDSISQKWYYFKQKNFIKRAYHGVVAIGIIIYVIGGFDGRNCYDSTYCFHIEKRHWSRKARMQETRCYVTAVGHQGVIYAIGGFDGDIRTTSCEIFIPRLKRWQYIADMNHGRSDASGAVQNDKIYVCGGFDGFGILNSAEMYDIEIDQWTFIPFLLGPRSGHSLISHKGSLIVMGGFNGLTRLNTVERFDEEKNRWINHTPMLSKRSNFAAAVLANELYVIGGYNGTATFADVEKLDDETEIWQKIANLKRDRSALGVCVVNNLEGFSTCSTPDEIILRRESMGRPHP